MVEEHRSVSKAGKGPRNEVKKAHSAPEPETIDSDVWYSFSFNPETQPIRDTVKGFKRSGLQEFDSDLRKFFKRLKYCRIKARYECSRGGRLHLHGCIQIKEIIEFYMSDYHKLKFHGTFEIDTIENEETWDIYVNKQKELMDDFCKYHGIVPDYDTERDRTIEVSYPKSKLLES